jgi:HTH-type transcriptional regulator / antitoxin HigA
MLKKCDNNMSYSIIKQNARALFDDNPYITLISNDADLYKAEDLIEDLMQDYENNEHLINILVSTIDNWNDENEFSKFYDEIELLECDVSVLKVMMDQYKLKAEDLKNEVGSKSLISMILSGKRKLTTNHIQALSDRFNISPALFFN